MKPMEFDSENALIRIHPGKLTDEQLKEVLIEGARKYLAALERQKKEHLVLVRKR